MRIVYACVVLSHIIYYIFSCIVSTSVFFSFYLLGEGSLW